MPDQIEDVNTDNTKKAKSLDGRIYKCENCGSFLHYDPDTHKLKCTHCASVYDLTAVKKAMELVYTANSETGYESWGGTKSVKCKSCGAVSILNDYETTSNCPFCGASNVVSIDDVPGLKPNAILPFLVSETKAHEAYSTWIKSKKMAPGNLKKLAEKQDVKGVYIPLFTFDTNTSTSYTIRYGQHYTVTVGSGKNRHTEVRTRWYVDSGFYNEGFNDIQVEASQNITQKDIRHLGGFDTDNCCQYHSQFITGYSSERYSTGLDESWETAKDIAEQAIRSGILRRYQYDVLDYLNISTSYSSTTFKYTLVPVWIVTYKYKGQTYKCIINGRNGKACGKAPVSGVKVGLLVVGGLIIVAVAIYLIMKYNN